MTFIKELTPEQLVIEETVSKFITGELAHLFYETISDPIQEIQEVRRKRLVELLAGYRKEILENERQ